MMGAEISGDKVQGSSAVPIDPHCVFFLILDNYKGLNLPQLPAQLHPPLQKKTKILEGGV